MFKRQSFWYFALSQMRENSGKSAKSLKIDRNPQNTSKFARNLIKYSHVNFSQATIIKGAHFSILFSAIH